jgi:hypothetical protein
MAMYIRPISRNANPNPEAKMTNAPNFTTWTNREIIFRIASITVRTGNPSDAAPEFAAIAARFVDVAAMFTIFEQIEEQIEAIRDERREQAREAG